MRLPPLLPLLLGVALAGAGCSGEGGAEAGPDGDLGSGRSDGASGDAQGEAPGVIEGVVSDTLFNPLEAVRVEVEGANLTAATDYAGSFRFAGLAVTVHTLLFSKQGFEVAVEKVNVVSTRPAEVDVQLRELPSGKPFRDEFDWRGFIECAASVAPNPAEGGFSPTPCVPPQVSNPQSGGVTNQRDRFLFAVNPGTRTIVAELDWDRETPLAPASMYLEVQTNGTVPFTIKSYEGPRVARIELAGPFLPSELPAVLQIHLTPPHGEPAVVAQQAFDVYVTVFYVDEAPYAWSRLSEAGG